MSFGTLHDGHVVRKRFVRSEVHLTSVDCIEGAVSVVTVIWNRSSTYLTKIRAIIPVRIVDIRLGSATEINEIVN
jgi:hypothetical protein